MLVRKLVAPNNDCLFASFAFLATPPGQQAATAKDLRQLCVDTMSQKKNFFMKDVANEVVLGFDSLDKYKEFITNQFNWGGENEILILADHYNVAVACASCETNSVLEYNQKPTVFGTIWLLYTGEHYDPLYIENGDVRILGMQYNRADLEKQALAIAKQATVDRQNKIKGKQKKMLQCEGCGALVKDTEEFQKHCEEVEHSEDFLFMCEEVIVNEKGMVVGEIPFQP